MHASDDSISSQDSLSFANDPILVKKVEKKRVDRIEQLCIACKDRKRTNLAQRCPSFTTPSFLHPADAREYVTTRTSHVFPPPDLTASVQREVEDKVELLIKPRRPAREGREPFPPSSPNVRSKNG